LKARKALDVADTNEEPGAAPERKPPSMFCKLLMYWKVASLCSRLGESAKVIVAVYKITTRQNRHGKMCFMMALLSTYKEL
jgi:hypothetical protein